MYFIYPDNFVWYMGYMWYTEGSDLIFLLYATSYAYTVPDTDRMWSGVMVPVKPKKFTGWGKSTHSAGCIKPFSSHKNHYKVTPSPSLSFNDVLHILRSVLIFWPINLLLHFFYCCKRLVYRTLGSVLILIFWPVDLLFHYYMRFVYWVLSRPKDNLDKWFGNYLYICFLLDLQLWFIILLILYC